MRKPVLIFTVLLLSTLIKAQDMPSSYPEQPLNNQPTPQEFQSFKDRIYLGGSVSGWIGSTTYFNLSPIMGIKINKKFSAGIGGTYNYFSQNYSGQKYTSTIYGSNVFGRYMINDNFFAQAQWDRLSVPDFASPVINERTWVHNLLIGGGYKQLFTERASFVAMIFYNINQTPLSPYTNPIVQIGFNVSLY